MDVKQRLRQVFENTAGITLTTAEVRVLCLAAYERIEASDDLTNAVVQYLTAVGTASEPLKAAMLRLTRKP